MFVWICDENGWTPKDVFSVADPRPFVTVTQ